MVKFEVGKTYQSRSICDADCIYSMTVAKRTAHFITTTDGKRYKVFVCDYKPGVEQVSRGRYSMAGGWSADSEAIEAPKSAQLGPYTLAALSLEWSAIAGEAVEVITNGGAVFTREVSEAGCRFLRLAMVRGRCVHTATIGWRFTLDLDDLAEMRARYTANGAAQ